jgi:hypothetical protein
MNTSVLLETNLNNEVDPEEIKEGNYFMIEIKPKSALHDKYD